MRSFITPAGTRALLEFIESHQDQKLVFEVRQYKRTRSLGLNAYHWAAVITPIADFMGESPEEAHRQLCGAYWGWVEKDLGGLIVRKPRRTTTTNEEGKRDVLNWEQMTNFVYFCKAKASDIGCPLANEVAA